MSLAFDLPESMRVIEISAPGGPEALRPAERPVPEPAAGEILIRVHAAGVNRPDALQRAGNYAPPPGASDLPGLECAGEVVAVGPGGGSRWRPGDRVCALLPGGGYAEYALTHQDHALPIPGDLSMIEAAALCETFFTVWHNVFERGRLVAGESFLVHGGSSGIGTTAIQLAAARGARVFATAGSAEKCAACEALGAERAINYRDADFVAVTGEATGGRGVDVILDMVGGDYFAKGLDCLKTGGRIVFIASLGGAEVALPIFRIMQKRAVVTGSTLRPRDADEKARLAAEVERVVWPWIQAGKLKPQIDKTFPLTEAAAAHAYLEGGAHVGKVMLVP